MKDLIQDGTKKKMATIESFATTLDLIEFSIEKDENSDMLFLSDTTDPYTIQYDGESFVDFEEVAKFISSIQAFEGTVVQTLEDGINNIVSEREEYSDKDKIPTANDIKSITNGQGYAEGIAKVIETYPTLEYYLREGDYGGDIDMLRAVTIDRNMLAGVRSFPTNEVENEEEIEEER